MAFVSYEGEVIPFESKQKKPDSFAKDSGGFGLSSMEQLTKETGDDWWKLPLITAIGGAAAGVAFGAGKSAFDWAKGKISPPPPPPQIEPTLGIEPPTSSKARSLEDAQAMSKKALANRVAITPPGVTPDVPIFTPQTNVPPTVQAPTAPLAGTQPPMGAIPPQQIAPTLTEAVATGQNATKAVQADVATMVDKTPAPEIVRTGTGRELIVGQGAEGGRFKTTYGAPQDVPAGYAFYPGGGVVDTLRQGLGQELFTKEFQVGNRPLPASIEEARNLIKDIKVAYNIPSREQLKAEGKPLPEQPKGIMRSKVTPTGESKGVIPVEVGGQKGTLMPKGKAQLGAGLPGMLSVLGLLGLSQTKDAKAAMEKASKAIKDIGISPDIMLRNPEEIGSLGRAYVTAGNPVYIRELSEQLATERDPDRRLMLTQEIIKAGGAVPPMR